MVHLTVYGGELAEVRVGESVTFIAPIEMPPAPGKVASAEWDFEGLGTYPDAAELDDPTSETVHATATHALPNRAPTSRRSASHPNVRAIPALRSPDR